ncbi:hypothetical protein K505DRAFT_91437 [Melanomma pulvis-pyrius CBS 109.77]|uniref:Uncharacterized protein n=1 Tax=Melanomma pulvis-pyrius CBS 109.77 TaxID=1314802 RepID=A0A6A6WZT4_9PLEO|nr:hypothetical protein K505DRAFT_91437 [Melanomma pulvis-pyrius CBS 109.77]
METRKGSLDMCLPRGLYHGMHVGLRSLAGLVILEGNVVAFLNLLTPGWDELKLQQDSRMQERSYTLHNS